MIFCFSFVEIVLRNITRPRQFGENRGEFEAGSGHTWHLLFCFQFSFFFYFSLFPVWWRLGTYDLTYFSVFILTPFSTEHRTSMLWFPHTPSAQISWIAKEYSPDSKAVMLFFVSILFLIFNFHIFLPFTSAHIMSLSETRLDFR